MEQVQLITLAEPLPAPVALVRRARLLAGIGLAWHTVEAAVAIGAGVVAGSVALVGFGADSLIEMLAGATLLWRFAASRAGSHAAEHGARRTIGASFFVGAAYVAVDATRQLALAHQPHASWVGIGLGAVPAGTMPPLASAHGPSG